jgi:hypothetical protein
MPSKPSEIIHAKQAITEQLHAYCRSMDRCDHQLGYAVWHPGGTADYGDVYRGTGKGFVDFALKAHTTLLNHCHALSNVLIKVYGNAAASEAYCHGTLRFERDDRVFDAILNARYIDSWSRKDDRWAIEHRLCGIDFDKVVEVDLALAGLFGSPQRRVTGWGRRDREDPSYEVLAMTTTT